MLIQKKNVNFVMIMHPQIIQINVNVTLVLQKSTPKVNVQNVQKIIIVKLVQPPLNVSLVNKRNLMNELKKKYVYVKMAIIEIPLINCAKNVNLNVKLA